VIDLDPSYVKSAKKLTAPIMSTNLSAVARFALLPGMFCRNAGLSVRSIDTLSFHADSVGVVSPEKRPVDVDFIAALFAPRSSGRAISQSGA
jgi:hypothetical protein